MKLRMDMIAHRMPCVSPSSARRPSLTRLASPLMMGRLDSAIPVRTPKPVPVRIASPKPALDGRNSFRR